MNFGLVDWLPFGMKAIEHYKSYKHQSVLPMEQLIFSIVNRILSPSSDWQTDTTTRMLILQQLEQIYSREQQERERVFDEEACSDSVMSEYTPTECIICRADTYFSFLSCSCSPHRTVCLLHAKHLCECSSDSVTLHYQHSLAALGDVIDTFQQTTTSQQCPETLPTPESGATARQKAIAAPRRATPEKWLQYSNLWLRRAADARNNRGPLEKIQALVREAGMYLWRGHDMNNLREVYAELKVIADWGTRLQNACDVPISLKELKELVSFECWLDISDLLQHHNQTIAKAEDIKSSAIIILQGCVEKEDIIALRGLLSTVKVFFDELDQHVTLVEDWYDQAERLQAAFDGDTSIDRLPPQALQQFADAATTLPVTVSPEIINRIKMQCERAEQWECTAKPLTDQVCTIAELEKAIGAHNLLGIAGGATLESLQARLDDAKKWVETAQMQIDSNALESELRCTLQKADILQIKFELYGRVKDRLLYKQWEGKAKDLLATPISNGNTDAHKQLLEDAKQTGVQGVAVDRVLAVTQEVSKLKRQLEQVISQEKPNHRVVAAMLKGLNKYQYSNEHTASLTQRMGLADKWCERLSEVRPCRKAGCSQPPLKKAQKLLQDAAKLTLDVDEIAQLKAQVSDMERWQKSAQDLLIECSYRSLDMLHRQAPLQLFWVPEMDQIQPQIERAMWKRRATRALSSCCDVELLQELVAEAKQQLKISVTHPAAGETFAQVLKVTSESSKLRARTAQCLGRQTSITVLRSLKTEIDAMNVKFVETEYLTDKLEKAEPLLVQLDDILHEKTSCLQTLPQTYKALQQLKVQPVAETLHKVKSAIDEADKWTKEARALLQMTEESLQHIFTHKSRLYAADLAGTFATRHSPDRDLCYCGDNKDDTKMMISCDICRQWYHCDCLDVTKDLLTQASKAPLQCPRCTQFVTTCPLALVSHLYYYWCSHVVVAADHNH